MWVSTEIREIKVQGFRWDRQSKNTIEIISIWINYWQKVEIKEYFWSASLQDDKKHAKNFEQVKLSS